jgi:hypothetical protein
MGTSKALAYHSTKNRCAKTEVSYKFLSLVLLLSLFWDLRNIPEERISHQHHGGSLKLWIIIVCC